MNLQSNLKSTLGPYVLKVMSQASEPLTAKQITLRVQRYLRRPTTVRSVSVCLTFSLDGRQVERVRPYTDPLRWKLKEPPVEQVFSP